MAKKAFKQVWKSITGVPAVDFAGKRYTAVQFNAEGDIIPAVAGGPVVGILEEPNNVGEPAQVVASGFMFAVLGATVAAGSAVMSDANGKLVAHVSAASPATNHVVGILQVGGVLNDIGTVLLK